MASLVDEELQMEVEADRSQMDALDCSTSFLETLSKSFMSTNFSDVTLKVGGKLYPAHKSFLAASSPYFERMFYGGDWKERKGQQVELEESPECGEVFPMFLQYFYKGSVLVNRKTVVPLVTLADKYDVKVLKDHCSQFMINNVTNNADIEGALAWLSFAEQMTLEHLTQICYDVICFNFEKAATLPSWKSLSFAQVVSILQRSDLVITCEYSVYDGVNTWFIGNQAALNRLSEMLPYIWFKNMTIEELMQIEQSVLACKSNTGAGRDQIKDYILEAFRYVAIIAKVGSGTMLENPPSKRIYTSGNCLQTVAFTNSFCSLVPACSWSAEPRKYIWQLRKSESGKYKVTLQNASINALLQMQSWPAPHAKQLLYNSIPGDIHVKLLIIFRDVNGIIHHVVNHSVDTKIPRAKRAVLIELPLEVGKMHGFEPHDVLYTFEILQS